MGDLILNGRNCTTISKIKFCYNFFAIKKIITRVNRKAKTSTATDSLCVKYWSIFKYRYEVYYPLALSKNLMAFRP